MLLTILSILLFINALILIILIIVMQQGNEGGIASSFGAGGQPGFFGPTGSSNIVVKATWIFGLCFFVLTTSSAWLKTHQKYEITSKVEQILTAPTTETIQTDKTTEPKK